MTPQIAASKPEPAAFGRWLEKLADRDPKLYTELSGKLRERLASPELTALESAGRETGQAGLQELALETIVREGRPALTIRDHRVVTTDAVANAGSREVIERLKRALPVVEPLIPLVGRIDVANHASSAPYLGTGWLVGRNLVVTNRHVAELIARWNGSAFVFRPGRFGEPLAVSLDYRHELGVNAAAPANVRRVIWIEQDAGRADIAFLEVDARSDGSRPDAIPLADADAAPNADVAVIGYPARAPSDIIPNQALMDEIYAGNYDVKRIAPGLMLENSRGWAAHDCTTLGGNSGSVVIDVKSGRAVALHFAGLYMIENYAVPVSTIRRYLREQPWQGATVTTRRDPETATGAGRTRLPATTTKAAAPGQVSITIPLTITVTLGEPSSGPGGGAGLSGASALTAAGALFREHGTEGVLAVRPGYVVDRGQLTDRECLVVAAHPERAAAVRAALPAAYAGFPVEVRPASLTDQLAGTTLGVTAEAVTSISYNDDERTGEGFSFDWINEEMSVLLHVGPERSWMVLSEFLRSTNAELVSSMYEFHARHIADAIEQELDEGASLKLVLATQSRDPRGGVPTGDFDRGQKFDRWETNFGDRFDRIFVPLGGGGLVANAYHIKVTVKDGQSIWLSSGNWKRSSQPLIPAQSINDPAVAGRAGNREWHVVIDDNATIAGRLRNHILADFERSLELGGTPEAVEDRIFVDVPAAMLEAIALEAPPPRLIEPLVVPRRPVRVKPLLTPDKKGKIYTDAVLTLIRSARRQLLFQNPYIKIRPETTGFLEDLVEALIAASETVEDFRIILRSENDSFLDDVSELKRRGLDVNARVRRLAQTHTKGIVVDGTGGKRVLVGSHNWSSVGVTLNRDASLIFDDTEIADYYEQAFDLDWERARPLEIEEGVVTEGPRLAVGPAPPPGFVRMALSDFLEG